ncbi:MAG: MBL fold metallo-hydrolase [Thermoguttaceae bacterium]|nr:MBL fold metallo-hydrolase [Thermoguttaceae bacterium]MBQ4204280.1 MBL fold metallo-hydrolase [Thermoguttaceae bacterium]
MDLIFLGTGNAHVTECYNTCFALRENGRIFLIDTGGGSGILHQLKYSGVDWREIHDIFITHKHVDHLLGAIWLIREFYTGITEGVYEGDVTFYGHDEVITLLRDIAFQLLPRKETRMFDDRIRFKVVADGQTRTIIGKETTFFDIVSIKAKQFGFSLDLGGGERFVCCGDEPCRAEAQRYAENSAWMLHEAFCLYSQVEHFKPYERHHSTVKDACELAERIGVRNLILYHTEDENMRDRKRLYTEEGRKYFTGNLYVPDDLERIEL